jgi:hypothetical protein
MWTAARRIMAWHRDAEAGDSCRDRKAAQARTEWLTERLATRHLFPTADATRLALLTWLHTITTNQAEKTALLLGLEAGPTRWNQVLLDEVEADAKRLAPLAATVAVVIAEETVREPGVQHRVARRCLGIIETWGHRPSEVEHSERLTDHTLALIFQENAGVGLPVLVSADRLRPA